MIPSAPIQVAAPRQRRRPLRLLALPTALTLLASLPTLAATVDGFVTNVDSQHSFSIGKLLITTDNQTECNSREVTRIRVWPSDEPKRDPKILYLPDGLLTSMRPTPVPCRIGKIAVGTRVHVTGDIQAAGAVKAGRLSIYTVRPSPAEKRSVAAGPSTQLRGNNLPADANPNIEKHDYKNATPAAIEVGYGEPILTVQSQPIQQAVYDLGMKLLQQFRPDLASDGRSTPALRFYVVKSSQALAEKEFTTVDGALPYDFSNWGRSEYKYKKSTFYDEAMDNAIVTPDGRILVPDRVLSRLHNQAQLAALLSYSITSVLQDDVTKSTIAVESASQYDDLRRFDEMLQIDQQVIRIGICEMYMAGYDIREAPFAWAAAQGKPVNNPVINSEDPDKEIPWYAAYAFNYISQYYPDVDYSKLKRGEKEYQQFLVELRKADPQAFAPLPKPHK